MSNTLDRSQLKFDRMPDIAGDPIIDQGSNADGEYIRFSNGTMICQIFGISSGSTGDATWTFPFTFANTNIVIGGTPLGQNRYVTPGAGLGPTTTLTSFRVFISDTGGLSNIDCNLSATGRWK
jgi:hypothetical protein